MKFLALEHELATGIKQDDQTHLRAEARRVWELIQFDIVREVYFRADQTTAVLILESPDVETAQASLASLPLVRAGLIEFELIPLIPYPGFARLFAADTD